MDIGIQKNGALSSSTYSLLKATKDKPGEINLKRLEEGRRHVDMWPKGQYRIS